MSRLVYLPLKYRL